MLKGVNPDQSDNTDLFPRDDPRADLHSVNLNTYCCDFGEIRRHVAGDETVVNLIKGNTAGRMRTFSNRTQTRRPQTRLSPSFICLSVFINMEESEKKKMISKTVSSQTRHI